ncbi:MAG: ATP-binding protein [Bacteroidales bacterium]|nr:ATP-binding protein [Bacteroidales bacterium]MDZ4204789.1 ATP-binding protein [Bacteroidales bacterium]
MSTYIKKLIAGGENQYLDFKFEVNDSRKIARSLVAFANTDGGTLLIGVKDNGVIAGVRSEEEYYMVQAAATMYCQPEIHFSTHEWNIDKKKVLEVTVQHHPDILYYAQDKDGKWLVYIRVDDHNLLANRVYLQARKKRKREQGVFLAYTEKEKLLLEYLDRNSNITLSKFLRLAGIKKNQAERILANFVALDIINQVMSESGCYYTLEEGFTESLTPKTNLPEEFLKW